MNKISESAGTTLAITRSILEDQTCISEGNATIIDSPTRFKLSIRAVKLGALHQVARALTWQEFESFSEECLQTTGFHTQKGVIVKDEVRRWQIDVIAKKGRMVLAVDCKHWESPGYESKLSNAAEHQKLALQALIQQLAGTEDVGREELLALPMILTLYEPRARIVNGVVVVSIEQFGDFLEGVSPYASEIPFVSAQSSVKSSIS